MKKHWVKLSVLLITLLPVVVAGVFVFAPVSFERAALALTGVYTKPSGGTLQAGEWNNLLSDFLAKDGGATVDGGGGPVNNAMTGNLDMNGNAVTGASGPSNAGDAVTMQYVDSRVMPGGIAEYAKTGTKMKVVCGSTPPGGTMWVNHPTPDIVYVDVYTTTNGLPGGTPIFQSPTLGNGEVLYFTSLGGNHNSCTRCVHETTGANSIYLMLDPGGRIGFRIYIRYKDTTINASLPLTDPDSLNNPNNEWYINWCGIGE